MKEGESSFMYVSIHARLEQDMLDFCRSNRIKNTFHFRCANGTYMYTYVHVHSYVCMNRAHKCCAHTYAHLHAYMCATSSLCVGCVPVVCCICVCCVFGAVLVVYLLCDGCALVVCWLRVGCVLVA